MMKKIICGGLLLAVLLLSGSALACTLWEEQGLDLVFPDYINPTDTEPGSTGPGYCPVCGELVQEPVRIPSIREAECQANGHQELIVEPATPATCEEPGLTEGSRCGYCGIVILEQEAVPSKGHAWGAPEYSWSTDYSRATAKRICGNDANHREEETVNSTSSVTPATTQAPGKIVYTAVFSSPFVTQTAEVILPQLTVGPYTDPNGTGNYDLHPDGTAVFTSPAGSGAAVSVPDKIVINGQNIPVTEIGDKAFYRNQKLKTVTIGKNVKTVGKNAFAGCVRLKTVKGGKGIVTLKESAFSGCKVLKTFPAPDKLAAIGANAFRNCAKMTKFTLGAAVKSIGKNAFNGCKTLKAITVKTEKLTGSNVKSGAFTGISKKAVFKCPKKKLKAYRTLFVKKGAPDTCRFK